MRRLAAFMTSDDYSGIRQEAGKQLRAMKWPGAAGKIADHADLLLDTPLTPILKRLPKDEWLRLDIDLQCFVDMGAKLDTVDTPFLLLTSGKLALSIADVRFVPGAGEGAAVTC